MHKQSKESKMDESLGMRRGKESTKKQSMEDRRHESVGASKADHHHKEIKHHMSELHKMAKKAQHKKDK